MRDHHADAQAIMDAHAKSFSWAARFLSRDARIQAAKLYAFARLMDDLVDEPELGSLDERMALFCENRAQVLGASSVQGRAKFGLCHGKQFFGVVILHRPHQRHRVPRCTVSGQ